MRKQLLIVALLGPLLLPWSAWGRIVLLPVEGRYIDVGLALASVQGGKSGTVVIRTTGLKGELLVDPADLPPDGAQAPGDDIVVPFTQDLELSFVVRKSNPDALFEVSGKARGSFAEPLPDDRYAASVSGKAACLRYNGQACGQIVVDLELRGVIVNQLNPKAAGNLRMKILGSLVRDGRNGQWQTLNAATAMGATPELIAPLQSIE